jgi:hypothetical protein
MLGAYKGFRDFSVWFFRLNLSQHFMLLRKNSIETLYIYHLTLLMNLLFSDALETTTLALRKVLCYGHKILI